jgi:hypothetical protein
VGRSRCGEAAARVGRHPEPAFALRPTLRLLDLSAGTRRLVVRVALHACVPVLLVEPAGAVIAGDAGGPLATEPEHI